MTKQLMWTYEQEADLAWAAQVFECTVVCKRVKITCWIFVQFQLLFE